MLSMQAIREQTAELRDVFARRGVEAPLDEIVELDRGRRELLAEVEGMRAERNQAGKQIGATRDAEERQRLIDGQRAVADQLDRLEERLRERDAQLLQLTLELPNTLHGDVPPGGEDDGLVVLEGKGAGEPAPVEPPRRVADEADPVAEEGRRPHWEIGEELGLIDFERGAKIAGSRFYVLRGGAARLQRALIAWMLDLHRERGFDEVYVPFVVKEEMLVGTGQLPKFAETMYHDAEDDLWLVPTAEVPVTNLYRDEILPVEALPIHHAAYTPCFRRERMSAGRDIRGLKRGHQFDKVELVMFCEPERSWEEQALLLGEALAVVQALGLRYRGAAARGRGRDARLGDDVRHRGLGAGLARVVRGLLGLELSRLPGAPREPALPRRWGARAAPAHAQRLRDRAAAHARGAARAVRARGRHRGARGAPAVPRRRDADRAGGGALARRSGTRAQFDLDRSTAPPTHAV